jgi:hypothetical protein
MKANAWEEIGKELKIIRKTWREDSVSTALATSLSSRQPQLIQNGPLL